MNKHDLRIDAKMAYNEKRSSLWHCQREKGKLKRDNEALLRVVRAAEKVAPFLKPWMRWRVGTWSDIREMIEALEALPEHLRCASGQ